MEPEADVHPGGVELSQIAPIAVGFGAFARHGAAVAAMAEPLNPEFDHPLLRWRPQCSLLSTSPIKQLQTNSDRLLGEVAIELCEMTYINHFGVWPRDVVMAPQDWLRGWSGDLGPEWNGETEDFAATSRFVLRRSDGQPFGRLTAAASTIIVPPAGDRSLQLEITVRGVPSFPALDGVREFHDMAHDQIVRSFAALTTEAAHEHWGRTQT